MIIVSTAFASRFQVRVNLIRIRGTTNRIFGSKSVTSSDGALVKLANERKNITNLIKMVAFQAESDLLALLRPHYARSDDEGPCTLLQELFQAAADIHVTQDQLCITGPFPSARRQRTLAVQALCDLLNETSNCRRGALTRAEGRR